MAKQSVDVLVSGGKATAAPPLGPALGPLKVNIGQVVAEINKKTADFAGMQVPVKVTVDEDTKEFEISIGTPPASNLIMKEANLKKGSSNPSKEKAGDLTFEQVVKVTGMKEDALLGTTKKNRVKEIVGTCQGMGVYVDGKPAKEVLKAIAAGEYDSKINN
ncbi:MAG: 50S ribosomal protein L11 [Candidatus Woesearchaeota archaeon]